MRARRLSQSQSQQLRDGIPDKEIPRIEEVAMAQFLETAQSLSRRDESRCRVDGEMPLEFLRRDVQSCLWGLATGDRVCCQLMLA